jgi:hypothetical protein
MDGFMDEATPPVAQGAVLWDDSAYLVAVADSLVFSLGGEEWRRLTAFDSHIRATTVRGALTALAVLGVHPSFGDGELPVIPLAGAPHIASLREQLRRIREVAPFAFAGGADTFTRILCTDRWPRIYTTAVLDFLPKTPVRVVQASDLAHHPAEWLRVAELSRFTDLRVLIMFGSPLARWPLPLDLGAFRSLRALDLGGCHLRGLPQSIAWVKSLEAIELSNNPIGLDELRLLERLPALRYVGLRGTEVSAIEAAALISRLADGCEVVI